MVKKMVDYVRTKNEVTESRLEFKPARNWHISSISCMTIGIVALSLIHIMYESYETFSIKQENMLDQGKTCLIEYSKLKCDVSIPNERCNEMTSCVQKSDNYGMELLNVVL